VLPEPSSLAIGRSWVVVKHQGWHCEVVTVSLRCELFPDDLDAALRFYVEILAFEVERDERTSSTPYAALSRGGVRLGLSRRPEVADRGDRRPPVGVELVLEVENLQAAHQQVVCAGWPIVEDLTDRPWGLTDFRVLDPAGYYWRITTADEQT